jgi:hypothetical protein
MATRKARSSTRTSATRTKARAPASKKKAAAKTERTTVKRAGGATRAAKKTAGRAKAPARPAAAKARKKSASARPRPTTAKAPRGTAARAGVFPCGDDAIRAATGKSWSEWLGLLDASGAAKNKLDHQQIWELAMQALPATAGWWGQMVSVGYERARGLREKHETSVGDYQATLSKTFPVPLFAAFAAWADKGLRGGWLDAPGLDFTKLNAGRNIRARWPGGELLDIRFTATGPDKCQIVVDTMKLPDAESVERAKTFWQAQFERLRAYLGV